MSKQHLSSSIFGDHPEEGAAAAPAPASNMATAPKRPSGHPRKSARRRQRGRRTLVLLVALVLVVGAGAVAFSYLRTTLLGPGESDDFAGPGEGKVTVVVHPGDSGRTIADSLVKAGVVKTPQVFTDAVEDHPDGASLQPGYYAMQRQMTGQGALELMLDPKTRTVPKATIREGLWASEVYAALSKATGTPVKEYQAAAKDPQAIGLPAQAKGNVEGWLFPSTYEFEPGATATTQLKTLVAKAKSELTKLGVKPERYQRVLTVASIVEAEVSKPADRAKVARVIENRLAADMPLQMDSTVHYAVRKRGTVTTTDAQRATKSPYNTYLVKGLPPGPINSPGASSMQAAVKPADGPWLYFVAVNPQTGETRFNTTLEGHQKDVAAFQAWCQANKGKC